MLVPEKNIIIAVLGTLLCISCVGWIALAMAIYAAWKTNKTSSLEDNNRRAIRKVFNNE